MLCLTHCHHGGYRLPYSEDVPLPSFKWHINSHSCYYYLNIIYHISQGSLTEKVTAVSMIHSAQHVVDSLWYLLMCYMQGQWDPWNHTKHALLALAKCNAQIIHACITWPIEKPYYAACTTSDQTTILQTHIQYNNCTMPLFNLHGLLLVCMVTTVTAVCGMAVYIYDQCMHSGPAKLNNYWCL